MVKSKEKRKKNNTKNENEIISVIANTIMIITTLLGSYNIYYVIKHPEINFNPKQNLEWFIVINQIPLITLGLGPVYYLFRIHGFF